MISLSLALSVGFLLGQNDASVKNKDGWIYYGPKVQTGDHWIWHRKREKYTQSGMMDKAAVPQDTNFGRITSSTDTSSSRLVVREGFVSRSPGVDWTLLKGSDWKGSQKVSKLASSSGRSTVSLAVPGGFSGRIYTKTTKEEWYEAFTVGTKRETRAIYEENSELFGVLVPAGHGFDTSTGEIVKLSSPN